MKIPVELIAGDIIVVEVPDTEFPMDGEVLLLRCTAEAMHILIGKTMAQKPVPVLIEVTDGI